MVHHAFVDFDDLVDDAAMPVGDRAQVAVALVAAEAIDDALAAVRPAG